MSPSRYEEADQTTKLLAAIGLLCAASRVIVYHQSEDQTHFYRKTGDDDDTVYLFTRLQSNYPTRLEFNPETGDVKDFCDFNEISQHTKGMAKVSNEGVALYIPVSIEDPKTGRVERLIIMAERVFFYQNGILCHAEAYLDLDGKIGRTPVAEADKFFTEAEVARAGHIATTFSGLFFRDQDFIENAEERRLTVSTVRNNQINWMENDQVYSMAVHRQVIENMQAGFSKESSLHVGTVGALLRGVLEQIIDSGDKTYLGLLPQELVRNPALLARAFIQTVGHDIGKLASPPSWLSSPKITDGQKYRSYYHALFSYWILAAIPGFRYGKEVAAHHIERGFLYIESFLAASGAWSDKASALMDPRPEKHRCHTLTETIAILGQELLEFVEKHDNPESAIEKPALSKKSVALLCSSFVAFLEHGVLESYARAQEWMFTRGYTIEPAARHAETKGRMFDSRHTLAQLGPTEYKNDITLLARVTGILTGQAKFDLTPQQQVLREMGTAQPTPLEADSHDVVNDKILKYFKEVLRRPDFAECLRNEQLAVQRDLLKASVDGDTSYRRRFAAGK